ncbi:hypothetical protein KM043_001148 [Ampulex compressa]|nr:hypothetical protein KM043_001148 [Ampulex compressa]
MLSQRNEAISKTNPHHILESPRRITKRIKPKPPAQGKTNPPNPPVLHQLILLFALQQHHLPRPLARDTHSRDSHSKDTHSRNTQHFRDTRRVGEAARRAKTRPCLEKNSVEPRERAGALNLGPPRLAERIVRRGLLEEIRSYYA